MLDRRKARTWAEIDLDALAHNYRALRALIGPECKLLAPVKADAYGHGAVQIAKKLQALGADMLAVACLDEGAQLRRAGIGLPILCLGPAPVELAGELLELGIVQMVEDLPTAQVLSAAAVAAGRALKVHVKVDTGMGRLGLLCTQEIGCALDQICQIAALPGLKVEGAFTHFAAADSDRAYTMAQLERFLALREGLARRGVRPEIFHCAASAAVLHYPQTHLDMVRPGLALYGHYPDQRREGLPQLRPVLTLKSRVAAVRSMPAGSFISYGCTARLERESKIAVLPIGYGDGLPRSLSGRLMVRIQGQDCPLLGRICMDLCMVDVTDRPETAVGDVAEIYGPGLTQRAAQQAGTISYELLSALSPRVPRLYFQAGEQIG